MSVERVTPDGEPFHFTTIVGTTVGERMRLESVDEWRVTTPIVSIERLEGVDSE